MKRRKDLEDYVFQPGEGARRGSWEYRGPVYKSLLPARALARKKFLLAFLAFLQCGFAAAVGIADTPGMRTLYVTLPFLGCLAAAGFCLARTLLLLTSGPVLSRRRWQRAVRGPETGEKTLLAAALLLLAGEVLYWAAGGSPATEVVTLAAVFLLAASAAAALGVLGTLSFEEAGSLQDIAAP